RVHARLGTHNAADYLERIAAGSAAGHVPVVQGLAWRSAGLDEEGAAAASAHLTAVALASAAVRLGAITHVDAQGILGRARLAAAGLGGDPPPDRPPPFPPIADTAMMRHETQPPRLFAS